MITRKKDLRGGYPLWAKATGSSVRVRRVLKYVTCDIAVVGGGVSGALTALALVDAGFDVVVIDRRMPGCGSTAASTAMIQFELDTPLTELIDKIGRAKAVRAYKRSLQSVKHLKALIEKHDIQAEWADREALYLAGDELGWRGLQHEASLRKTAGLPSRFLDAQTLRRRFGIDRTGAILSKGAAEVNPAQLTAGALKAAQAEGGARIYGECEVTHIDCGDDGVTLSVGAHASITAQKVVLATGYETVPGLPSNLFEITSSWAIATEPIAPSEFWPTKCLIWEAADPYLYMRATADNRILAGGEDSGLNDPERRDAAIATKSAKLLKAIETLLPGRELKIAYAWAGAFATSPTGLPIIQEIDEMPGCLAILGCGGNGITFSMIASEIATKWATGKTDKDADLFERAGKPADGKRKRPY
ncbi:MAG: FAD-binding oxidoreductase [Hyphomicrobium sp.]|nr:FAD-binding oxidoreductase [Hyphomicrobium sp.]